MFDDELKHLGTPRHSGRYPYGSGDTPYQRHASFMGNVYALEEKGLKETEIAKGMGMNTSELRRRISLARVEMRAYEASEAQRLLDKGYSKSAIARRMQKNESSIRLLLNPVLKERNDATSINAKILKDAVAAKKYIDIGAGTEQHMGISQTRLSTAVAMLRREGYEVFNNIKVEQLGTGKDTTYKVLAAPGTTASEMFKNRYNIKMVDNCYSEDGGITARVVEPPKSIDSKRIFVRYAEDGGVQKDGLVELRRGVPDISLDKARYAQVRIAVDDTHYIKGMAVHTDDIPPGYDIVFNTNKKRGTPMMGESNNTVLKPMKDDPDNPFGASIKQFDDQLIRAQRHYKDKNGKEQLSTLNIVSEEGNWSEWTRTLASQMLSKQSPALAKRQLTLAHDIAKEEFNEIMSFTNPTVRATLLDKFADQCDSDATTLKAAPLPGQTTKVILPFPSVPENEIYAPSYKDGQKVVLIRYPHGGTFEIPTLMVNNKHKDPKDILGNAIDAVGINAKVAERLSGADFDGDNVLVIPVDNVKIKTTDPLEGLKNFNPKEQYRHYEGMRRMTSHDTGLEMGKVSNLITDMTTKGATREEICRAVRHSMVVIDAEKHYLNYKQSEIDNDIAGLKAKYQGRIEDGRYHEGASTLISKSTSEVRIPQRKEKLPSRMTPDELAAYKEGKMIYEDTGKTVRRKSELDSGEIRITEKLRTEKVPRMMLTDDAYSLVSGSPSNTTIIEKVYADYANSMKALANAARKEARLDLDIPYNPSARIAYSKEEASLRAKLNIALKNAPLERQAQLLANLNVKTKLYNNPGLDDEHIKRLKGMELDAARRQIGAKKITIGSPENPLTDREWEAINAGAISKTSLKNILKNADISRIRELATPRTHAGMTTGKIARAKSMLNSKYTQAEVAEALGVSVSTLVKAIGVGQF